MWKKIWELGHFIFHVNVTEWLLTGEQVMLASVQFSYFENSLIFI